MTPDQRSGYWNRWQRCAAIFKSQGLNPAQIDTKRRTITCQALGYEKSMSDWKRWKNDEVDKVFAAFAAIYDDCNLNAQLNAIDQPQKRYLRVVDECKALVAELKDWHPDHPEYNENVHRYLNTLAYSVCRQKYDFCTDRELQKIAGILRARIVAAEKAIQREAAKATEDVPF